MLAQRNLSDVGSDVGVQTSASITSIRHAAHDAVKVLQHESLFTGLIFNYLDIKKKILEDIKNSRKLTRAVFGLQRPCHSYPGR